jgi:hypothetical protein
MVDNAWAAPGIIVSAWATLSQEKWTFEVELLT